MNAAEPNALPSSQWSKAFKALMDDRVLSVLVQQQAFEEWLGEPTWKADLNRGMIDFGEGRRFPVQYLGTEFETNGSWLWAWANPHNESPQRSQELVAHLANMGVPEFAERALETAVIPASMLATMAAALHGRGCYFRGSYPNSTAAYFVVEELPESIFGPQPTLRCLNVMAEALQQFELDQQKVLNTFLHTQGFKFQPVSHGFHATRGEETISIEVDDHGRVVALATDAEPV